MKSYFQKDNFFNESKKEIEEYNRKMAKNSQIDSFVKGDVFEKFAIELANKRWTIFKAPTGFKFWTNDNPGFSPNMHPLFQDKKPFHHHF